MRIKVIEISGIPNIYVFIKDPAMPVLFIIKTVKN